MDGAVIDDDMSQAMSLIKDTFDSVIVEDIDEQVESTPPRQHNNNMIEIMIQDEL